MIYNIYWLFFTVVNPSFQNQMEISGEIIGKKRVIHRKKILKISIFPLSLESYNKSGEFDKNQESGRTHIKSGGLESLMLLYIEVISFLLLLSLLILAVKMDQE